MHIVALGHDKKLFDTQSRSYARQQQYAALMESLTILIPTRQPYTPIATERLVVLAVAAPLLPLAVWRLLVATYRAVAMRRRTGPTVLIVQSPFEFGLLGVLISRLLRIPLQVQVHGDFYSRSYWRTESWTNRLRAVVGLWVLRRASGVRVVSTRIATSLQERGVPAERITVLPIEADLHDFVVASPQPIWPQDTQTVTILSVGRFAPEKNFPLLIRSFYAVHRSAAHARLVLIGEGPEEALLRRLVASLWPSDAPVSLYPWRHDIAAVMKAADIYALSSDHEGYAMVLGEAMACGVPIVTTEVGCVGELVVPEVHGLVVPPRDEAAYTAALNRMVGDAALRTRLGAAGAVTAAQVVHTPDHYPKALVATWQSLIYTT